MKATKKAVKPAKETEKETANIVPMVSKHKEIPIPEKRTPVRAAHTAKAVHTKIEEEDAPKTKGPIAVIEYDEDKGGVYVRDLKKNPLAEAVPEDKELNSIKETVSNKKSSLKNADKPAKAPKKERGLSNEEQAVKFLTDGASDKVILAYYTAVYAAKGITDEKFIRSRTNIYMNIAKKRVKVEEK